MRQIILSLFILVMPAINTLAQANEVLKKPEAHYETKLKTLGFQHLLGLHAAITQLMPHRLRDFALSADGKTLATAHSHNNLIQLWDREKGVVIHAYDLGSWINRMRFHNDYLAAGTKEGLVFIWDMNTKKQAALLTTRYTIADIQFIDNQRIAILHNNGKLHLWDFKTGKKLADFTDGRLNVMSAGGRYYPSQYAHSGSADHLDYRNGVLVSGGREGLVKVWDLATKALKWTFSTQSYVDHVVLGDKNQLITLNKQGQMQLWDIKTGLLTHIFPKDEFFLSATFTKNNHLASLSKQALKLWDMSTKKTTTTLKQFEPQFDSVEPNLMKSTKDLILYRDHSNAIDIWDAVSALPLQTHFATGYDTNHLAFHNNLIAQATTQGHVYIWDRLTNRPQSIVELESSIKALRFNAKGNLAIVAESGRVFILDNEKQNISSKIHTQIVSDAQRLSILYFDQHKLVLSNYHPHRETTQVEAWDTRTGKRQAIFETKYEPAFAYMQQNKLYLAIQTGYFGQGLADINLYHLASGKLKHSYKLTQTNAHYPSLIHPIGKDKLLITYNDNKLELRERDTGRILEESSTEQSNIDAMVIKHSDKAQVITIPQEAPLRLKLYLDDQYLWVAHNQGLLTFSDQHSNIKTLLLAVSYGQWLSAEKDEIQIATHHQSVRTKLPMVDKVVNSERFSDYEGKIVNESHHYVNYKVAPLHQPESHLPIIVLENETVTLKQDEAVQSLSISVVNTSEQNIHQVRLIPNQTVDGLVKLFPTPNKDKVTLIPANTSHEFTVRIASQGVKGRYKLPIQVEVAGEKKTEMMWLDVEVQ